MTEYTSVNIDDWVRKTQKRQTLIAMQAISDTIADVEVVPGINRGGARIRGTIPRDFGVLARSKKTTLYGSTVLSDEGEDSHVITLAGFVAGDVIRVSWGGPLAGAYAKAVHDGSDGTPGTHWMDEMAAAFPKNFRNAVKRARAQVR